MYQLTSRCLTFGTVFLLSFPSWSAPLELTPKSFDYSGEIYPSTFEHSYSKNTPFMLRFFNHSFNLNLAQIESINLETITPNRCKSWETLQQFCSGPLAYKVKSKQKTIKSKHENYHLLIMKAFDPNQGPLPPDTEIDREDDKEEEASEHKHWLASLPHKIRILAGMYIAKTKQSPPMGYCLIQQQTTRSPYPELALSAQAQQSLATIRAWPLSQRIKVKAQLLPTGYNLQFYERRDGEMIEIYGFLETPGETFMVLDSYFPPALEKDVLRFAKHQLLAHIHQGWKFSSN